MLALKLNNLGDEIARRGTCQQPTSHEFRAKVRPDPRGDRPPNFQESYPEA